MKYFIIVDMQNDFVTGTLACEAAKNSVNAIVAKAKDLKEKGYRIIATRDTQDAEKYENLPKGVPGPVRHCIKDEKGWEVVDELKDLVDVYVNKHNFTFEDWRGVLNANLFRNPFDIEVVTKDPIETEEILICGTRTSIGVIATYENIRLEFPKTSVNIIPELCTDDNEETHKAALQVIKIQNYIKM